MGLASFPMAFLSQFHTREFKQLDYNGSPQWQLQLRRWRWQDRWIWIWGSLYTLFCVNFILLFFASVVPEDQNKWIISALTAFVEDMLVIPLASAVCFPLLAMAALAA